jgi:hypothetical protein
MTTLASLLLERVLLLDGGMGTQILARKPSVDDFGGTAFEGCMELLNERRPDWIREIHAAYLDAGADAVETNSFGANQVVLAEFGIPERTEALNSAAARLALEVARSYDRRRYVIGSVGPGTKLLTLGHISYAALYASCLAQMRGLVMGGVDAILIETAQDLGQIKCAVRAARTAMAQLPGLGAGHGGTHRHPAAGHRDPGGAHLGGDARDRRPGPELRHRAGRDARPPAGAGRGLPVQPELPAQRRPAGEPGWFPGLPARARGVRRQGGPAGPEVQPQHRRRLLRHHPGAHPRPARAPGRGSWARVTLW